MSFKRQLSSLLADNGGMGGEYAYRIGNIPIDAIVKRDDRMRPIDADTVKALKGSVQAIGLLQPIGVRATRGLDGGPYELIYGAHRVQAFEELFDEGKCELKSILGIIFTSYTPDSLVKMMEISTNLFH